MRPGPSKVPQQALALVLPLRPCWAAPSPSGGTARPRSVVAAARGRARGCVSWESWGAAEQDACGTLASVVWEGPLPNFSHPNRFVGTPQHQLMLGRRRQVHYFVALSLLAAREPRPLPALAASQGAAEARSRAAASRALRVRPPAAAISSPGQGPVRCKPRARRQLARRGKCYPKHSLCASGPSSPHSHTRVTAFEEQSKAVRLAANFSGAQKDGPAWQRPPPSGVKITPTTPAQPPPRHSLWLARQAKCIGREPAAGSLSPVASC